MLGSLLLRARVNRVFLRQRSGCLANCRIGNYQLSSCYAYPQTYLSATGSGLSTLLPLTPTPQRWRLIMQTVPDYCTAVLTIVITIGDYTRPITRMWRPTFRQRNCAYYNFLKKRQTYTLPTYFVTSVGPPDILVNAYSAHVLHFRVIYCRRKCVL